MFPFAPTGVATPPAVAEAKARRRRERKERNIKGVQDEAIRKERIENRRRLKEQAKDDEDGNNEGRVEGVDLQRIDALTQLKIWLGNSYLRFSQVQNVSPGWILIYETREGLPLSLEQYDQYKNAAQRSSSLLFTRLDPPEWWQVGMLKYPPVQETLAAVGFGQFVNFFGNEEPVWAIEISVALELGLFTTAWVDPAPLVDNDWENGGVGPFLLSTPASMIDEGRVDPKAEEMNELQERESMEYTMARLQKPGVVEADRPDDSDTVTPAATTEMESFMFKYDNGVPNPQLVYALKMYVESIASHAIKTEVGSTDEYKIEAFLRRITVDVATNSDDSGFVELEAVRRVWSIFGEIEPPRPEIDDFIEHVIQFGLKEYNPPGGWPNVAAPTAYDLPPAPGLTVADVNRAVAEKQATRSLPTPQEYHSILDYMKTDMGREALGALERGVGTNFNNAAKAFLPSIQMRRDLFFVRLGKELKAGTRADAFFSDNQNDISDPEIVLGSTYQNNPSFTMEDVFEQTIDANGYRSYSVAADQPESFGLFGHKQMEHLYEHLFLKAKPLFSVSADKAVQFFPSSYVCSNVWWWESKLEKLPIGTEWVKVGKGGFNFAYRLRTDALTPGAAALAYLPPALAAYGAKEEFQTLLPSMMQHGLIKRVAWAKPNTAVNITTCIRELYLACYAASCGVGPKILAAYLQPEGMYPGYLPSVEMNPGDSEERFANPIYETKHASKEEEVWKEADAPPDGWFAWKTTWSDAVEKHNELVKKGGLVAGNAILQEGYDPSYNAAIKNNDYNKTDPRTYGWKKMVVVMESYEGDMGKGFKMPNSNAQRKKVVEALMKTFKEMGEAGILHCDIKPANMVYRTWFDGKNKNWSKIETRTIDFDPRFVKVVPWLPGPVIALINAACFFSVDACFRNGRFIPYTKEHLQKLHEEVMQNYPDGVAQTFRALMPFHEEDIPFDSPSEREPSWLSRLFNDEHETAEAFFRWIRMYLNNPKKKKCETWRYFNLAPDDASVLARLLAMAQYNDPSKALRPFDPSKRGNFPFATRYDPHVRMQLERQASSHVWGGLVFNRTETGSEWHSEWDSGIDTEWDSEGESEKEE